MEVRHVFLADYFTVDDGGKFVVGGGFSQFNSTEYPAKFTGSFLIVLLESRTEEEKVNQPLKISIRSGESGLEVSKSEFPNVGVPHDAPDEMPVTINVRVSLDGLVIPGLGTYYFDVYLSEELKTSLRLTAGLLTMVGNG